jgi:hypothetical protein
MTTERLYIKGDPSVINRDEKAPNVLGAWRGSIRSHSSEHPMGIQLLTGFGG